MIALVGAMFVAMGSVSAVEGRLTLEIGGSEDVAPGDGYEALDEDGSNTNPDDDRTHNVMVATVSSTTIAAVGAGTTVVTFRHDTDATANPDKAYEVTVLPFGFKSIKSDDSDEVVKAGTQVKVTVTLNSQTENSEVTLTLPTTGLSIANADATSFEVQAGTTQQLTLNTNADKMATFTVNTAGAGDGEYVFTFVADRDNTDASDAIKDVSDTSYKLTIGDAGTGLASATLGPNNVDSDGAPSTASSATPDKTTKPKGSTIQLVVTAMNSLGETANPGDVNQVIVFAVGGTIDGLTKLNTETFAEVSTDTPDVDNVGANQEFSVHRATPGRVTVSATVVGSAGDVKTNELDLVFTGDAEAISLGAPSDVLGQGGPGTEGDSITVEVTAKDDAGSPASISPLQITSAKVLDSEGNAAENITATEAQKQDTKGTEDTDDDTAITTAVVITLSTGTAAKAEAGAYTLEVKLGTKDTATTEFAVAGPVDTVMLDVSEPDEKGRFTVTATAKDAAGNPVIDDTPVTFKTADQRGDFDPVLHVVRESGTTKGGTATGTYVEIGPGRATIIVTVGGDDGVTEIARHVSAYGEEEPEAMPEEEASLGCLSSLSGFSTWTCDVEASASEIFDWISSRGATALHLNSNRMWVRYSVVDGAMVPGSSDFMVTKSDILYISN